MYDNAKAVTAYLHGEHERAAAMFLSGAEEGDIFGAFNYAHCLWRGIGIEKDAAAARSFFTFASELSGGDAQYNLAILYMHGDDLLKVARMSRTAYLDKFKRVTGTTPGKFIAARRVEIAKDLLADQSVSLGKIAAIIGCFDTSHFIRLFSKHTGVTPTEYRQSLTA